jgi:hypothetical protein
MKKELINELFARFEAASGEVKGVECWSARELQNVLGYTKWSNFVAVIDKAREAGWVKPQGGIDSAGFAAFLAGLLSQPEHLKEAAAAALRHGKPDAARRLADLMQSIMAR